MATATLMKPTTTRIATTTGAIAASKLASMIRPVMIVVTLTITASIQSSARAVVAELRTVRPVAPRRKLSTQCATRLATTRPACMTTARVQVSERSERALTKTLDHTRDEFREMTTDGYIHN